MSVKKGTKKASPKKTPTRGAIKEEKKAEQGIGRQAALRKVNEF